jgi:hypothetical protein
LCDAGGIEQKCGLRGAAAAFLKDTKQSAEQIKRQIDGSVDLSQVLGEFLG